MVVSRSLGSSMVRVAMMPGTAQAKLDSSGMKARPDRPAAVHQLVHQEGRADHVARALEEQDEEEQDQDLRQEGDAPRRRRRSRRRRSSIGAGPAGSALPPVADSQATPSAIHATGAALHENTAWNIRNMIGSENQMDRRPGEAAQRRADGSSGRTEVSLTTAALAISRARRWRWMRSFFTAT